MTLERFSVVSALGLVLTLVSACHVDKQQAAPAAPDISGTWEAHYDTQFDPDHPPPPGGPFDIKEPYATAYKKLKEKQAQADAAGTPLVNASVRCRPEGMPQIMRATYPIQILQTPGQVTVLAEFLTQTRRIWLDEKMPALDDISPSYNGHSVGHWEGDTLVIETIGIRTDVVFFDVPHTENMKLTERIRRVSPDMLEDHIVIDDPQILNKPYAFSFHYKKSDYKITEYICDDNQIVIDKEGGTHFNLESNQQ